MSTTEIWISTATARLKAAGVDSPRLSAELLAAHASGLDRLRLRTWPDTPLLPEWLDILENLLARREQGEPMAYLIGTREFFGRDFLVTPHTLIPRPETELLVEAALKLFGSAPIQFADFGTGSGCIAVTLCAERPHWSGLAVDASAGALATAAENAHHYHTHGLCFARADFTRPLLADGSLDLLVSNPPYVSEAEYADLSPEVARFEPKNALVPGIGVSPVHTDGSTGLEHAALVITAAGRALHPGGVLLMEHGWTQGPAIQVLLENNTWHNPLIHKDLAGLNRFVSAVRAPY